MKLRGPQSRPSFMGAVWFSSLQSCEVTVCTKFTHSECDCCAFINMLAKCSGRLEQGNQVLIMSQHFLSTQ